MPLTGQALGQLNEIMTEVKFNDPFNWVKEIHVGYVHPHLEEEYLRSKKEKKPILLIEMGAMPVFINGLLDADFVAIRHDDEIPRVEEPRPTKSWLKRYGKKE
jgi:hypothetical protein